MNIYYYKVTGLLKKFFLITIQIQVKIIINCDSFECKLVVTQRRNKTSLSPQLPSHFWLFCDPMDCSLPGSSVHGISQARILELVAISSSRGSSQPWDRTQVSYVSWVAGGFFTHWATCCAQRQRYRNEVCSGERFVIQQFDPVGDDSNRACDVSHLDRSVGGKLPAGEGVWAAPCRGW